MHACDLPNVFRVEIYAFTQSTKKNSLLQLCELAKFVWYVRVRPAGMSIEFIIKWQNIYGPPEDQQQPAKSAAMSGGKLVGTVNRKVFCFARINTSAINVWWSNALELM